jgi:hypothetical protein
MEGGEHMSKYTAGVKTVLLVFLATVVGLLVTNGAGIVEMHNWSDWKPYVTAGIAAVLVFVYNYLSPYDNRYGIGSK